MSTVRTNNVQVGQSVTATNNFTLYQPATPDGTVRLGNGNSGSVTDVASFTSAGVFAFNSGYGSVAPAYACRAWVNFNGTGTPAIRASANVSSLTDNGTGDYTINFTNAMPDGNYVWAATGGDGAGVGQTNWFSTPGGTNPTSMMLAGSLRIKNSYQNNTTNIDLQYNGISVFR
jgi:hypothetical protein